MFFRLLLALPHLVWISFWAIGVLFVSIFNWFATLFRGSPPLWCHNFLTAFVRYSAHLVAYLSLTSNKFPDFVGRPGSYPVDIHMPEEPQLQNRWKTGFRVFLAVPALLVSSALSGTLFVTALLGWFAGLFTARMPRNLRQAQLLALRYGAQLYAYGYLLTDRYPFASPAPPAATEPSAASTEPALSA